MILDNHVEVLLEKYIKNNSVVSFGTGQLNELFLKKLAIYAEKNNLKIKFVPTSHRLTELCSKLKIETVSLDDNDIDVAFDFVNMVDEDFNYISNETTSLIRDKMIAQNAGEMIVVCEDKNFVKKLCGKICLEVNPFAINKTLLQIMNLGEPKLRVNGEKPALSETGNYFVDIELDDIYSLDDLEFQAKNIPCVLETSVFIGYADRVVLHGDKVVVKSRMTNKE
ncbi:MAG: ribose-5-phosphate isomerase A [Candidatus Diapherotrites archaeon]|nr:ribose-5-phosphate isomerase A [Candidatus Diapherotrites archaeon]